MGIDANASVDIGIDIDLTIDADDTGDARIAAEGPLERAFPTREELIEFVR